MNTKDLAQLAADAYAMISSLRVSGDAVDVVAAARAKLRKLTNELSERAAAKKTTEGSAPACAMESCMESCKEAKNG